VPDDVGIFWDSINYRLQGPKPKRWISLNDAVWIIAQKLKLQQDEARELLQKEALPPAVPWVGLWCAMLWNGRPFLPRPKKIDRATAEAGEVNFNFTYADIGLPADKIQILDIHIELNHLEAWLEKRMAPVGQPVPASPEDRPVEGEMTDEMLPDEPSGILPLGPYGHIQVWTPPAMPWGDMLPPEGAGTGLLSKSAAEVWDDINLRLQGDKPTRWIELEDAGYIIAKKLGVLPGEACDLLRKEAAPPAVPWVGLECDTEGDGTRVLRPRQIPSGSLFTRAEINFCSDDIFFPPRDEHMWWILVELNHLEAWIEKRKAPVTQPVPSATGKDMAPKNKGGRPASALKTDVRIRLTAFVEKRGEPWVKHQTTSQLAKEVRAIFERMNPPVDLGPRQTLEDWIRQWRSERGLDCR
jgi:hypothetical protein